MDQPPPYVEASYQNAESTSLLTNGTATQPTKPPVHQVGGSGWVGDRWEEFKIRLYRWERDARKIEVDFSWINRSVLWFIKRPGVATSKQKELAARRLPSIQLWIYILSCINLVMTILSCALFGSKTPVFILIAICILGLIPFNMFATLRVLVSEELNFSESSNPKTVMQHQPVVQDYGVGKYQSIRDVEEGKHKPQQQKVPLSQEEERERLIERDRRSVFFVLYLYCVFVGLLFVLVVGGLMAAAVMTAVGSVATPDYDPDSGTVQTSSGVGVGVVWMFVLLFDYILLVGSAGLPAYMLIVIERIENPFDQQHFKYTHGKFDERWLFEDEETRGLWHSYHFICCCVPFLRETLQITTHRIVVIRNLLFPCWGQPEREYVMAWLRDLPSMFIGPPATCCLCFNCSFNTNTPGLTAVKTDCINWPCCPFEDVRVGEPGHLHVVARMQSTDVTSITNCFFEVQEPWKINLTRTQGPPVMPTMNQQVQFSDFQATNNNNSNNPDGYNFPTSAPPSYQNL